MILRVLHSQSKTVAFGAFLLAGSSLLSSVLGLFRDRLLASTFGAGVELDMYFAAFRIPDFLYGILILGGLSASFLPVFSGYFQEDQKRAWKFAGQMLNVLVLALGGLAAVLFFFIPFLMPLVVPGFSSQDQETTSLLARVMLLSPIFFGISALFSSLLQYFNRFLAFSLAPVMYNLGILGGIVFLVPFFGITGVALGVVAGAVLHIAIQLIPAFSAGFKIAPFSFSELRGIKRVAVLALPRTIGSGAAYLNPVIMTALASTFAAGSIAIFSFANNLQMIPVGVVGISFSLAVFPHLSRAFAKKDTKEFSQVFSLALRQIIFLALPLSLFLFLLRAQIVRLVLGSGEFGWQDTRLTSAALGIFAAGIVFQALIPFLMRTFFSLQNTRIPAISSVIALGINAVLAVSFVRAFQGGGVLGVWLQHFLRIGDLSDNAVIALPLALVFGTVFQCAFLLFALGTKVQIWSKEIIGAMFKLLLACFALIVASYIAMKIFGTLFLLTSYGQVLWQTVLALVSGTLAFLLVSYAVQSQELKEFFHSFKKQFHE
ncbi:MAG: murein biosynthesis integral membrane protein MurJ [Candidatus Wildermuthbacteria bacterium]|nr:murein biosynthesis integral membrane protein MurJ [Candidatus Wildermuthbacteria bacterium]